jgi:hypothetical protein
VVAHLVQRAEFLDVIVNSRLRHSVFVVLLAATSCSPFAPSSLAGDWSGWVPPGHFNTLLMRFTQHGDGIVGVACYMVDDSVVWRDVPVQVDDRNVSFMVPMGRTALAGSTFSGLVASDGVLYGEWSIEGGSTSRVSLVRGFGTYCGG